MELETTREPFESVRVRDFVLKSKLGGGSLATIWRADNIVIGEELALKQIYLSKLNKHLRSCLECELNFLSSVNHPHIIRLYDAFEVESCMFLVLELCSGGNLASFIRCHGHIQELTARRFMQQLGAGLKILHSHHIIHRDLKPENILLSGSEDDLVLKIADFGLSRTVHRGSYADTVCGSPLYMAPEILQFQRYDEKVDMWSTGAILFELLNGYPPFHGRSNVQLLRNIKSCTCLPFSQLILPGLHPDCVDICTRLLALNPVDRLSFDEFYQHRFLKRIEVE
ncbi:serine/threonine-protein kinase ATG1t isoform X1 [Tripterygium wilfordii]|uniref:serine/threonine-protein kinase ATG1t isoform X1 n=1 Tax=Tripterygium wilfordii TaxID=458696 RepID=UPI0018F81160|nr:serine/threonine-protein kinase ATG1t isoform X1 [Tripterygium wilfordii]XP_038693576.1 serine/threonine-protein kinase ATG1t isoform X1 [Tripterygium wilfordii]XP_038693577.1 serine/threonine-protein kinase ATG1t isoform X1 [Tripterygium wilfordii]